MELQTCEHALAEHQPQLVLCCWQPLGVDWTAAMRATPSVLEYCLVGQADSMCGDAWLTWGEPTRAHAGACAHAHWLCGS